MTKVVILGISGLDADLLRVYGPLLPTVRHLMLESPFLECRSSFPPVPAAAWASIYRGLNPANHGITGMSSIDDFQNGRHQQSFGQATYEGTSFWDVARLAGKRVCVINPLGVSGTGAENRGSARVYSGWAVPQTLHKGGASCLTPHPPPLPPLLDDSMISQLRKPDEFCHLLYERTSKQAAIGLKMLKREAWDLFFLQFDALDYVQHLLWRYSDPGDGGYPGRNAYSHLILDFYHLFDRIIGSFRAAMQEDCVLMIVSGYGFGRRCIHRLQVNEWLHGRQLLTARSRSRCWLNRHYRAEPGNARPTEVFAHLRLWDGMLDGRRFPASNKDLSCAASGVLGEKTIAQVADLAGVSPFGGIRLNRACIEQSKRTYEQVRNALLTDLTQLRVKEQRVVNWAKAREDVYSGTFVERFPDILFELRSGFGVDTQLYVPLVVQDPLHRLISGERTMSGVLLLGNLPEGMRIPDDIQEPVVEDVAPTILRLLDVTSADLDGKALVQQPFQLHVG